MSLIKFDLFEMNFFSIEQKTSPCPDVSTCRRARSRKSDFFSAELHLCSDR